MSNNKSFFTLILGGIFLALLIIIKFSGKPEDVLQKHLKNKYKEEFVITMLGKREGIKERKKCIATGTPFDKEKELGAFVRYVGDLDIMAFEMT